MRGIILAGGTGSRLWPVTKAISKHLMPVFDKPMIYYPLSTLVMAGIRDILLITTPDDVPGFRRLLADGSHLGIRLSYATQPRPEGVAQALTIGADFVGDQKVALILGDNIFHGAELAWQRLKRHTTVTGCHIFAYPVADPRQFGVVEFDERGSVLSIEEKPEKPRSRYAVPGLYFYDNRALGIAGGLCPSERGELEISEVNDAYLRMGEVSATVLERGTAWLDTGTFASLVQAAEFVRVVQERQGLKIGCVEEACWRMGFIDDDRLRALAEPLRKSGYGQHLLDLLAGEDGTPETERPAPPLARWASPEPHRPREGTPCAY